MRSARSPHVRRSFQLTRSGPVNEDPKTLTTSSQRNGYRGLVVRAAAQAFSSNDASRGWMFLAVALLDLFLVVLLVALGRAFADRAKPTPKRSH
jgi:hypothetical protein